MLHYCNAKFILASTSCKEKFEVITATCGAIDLPNTLSIAHQQELLTNDGVINLQMIA